MSNGEAGVTSLTADMKAVKMRLAKIEKNIDRMAMTLDVLPKRLTTHEQEFELFKNELNFVKRVPKERLHVDIEGEMRQGF